MTGLHWACKRNHPDIVQELLKSKAHVNSLDLLNRHPLYYAFESKSGKCAHLLFSTPRCTLYPKDKRVDYSKMLIEHEDLLQLLQEHRRVVYYYKDQYGTQNNDGQENEKTFHRNSLDRYFAQLDFNSQGIKSSFMLTF